MSKLTIDKVPSADDLTLPVFAEFDEFADRIRDRAYKLCAGRGFGDGRALDDWLLAEREVCWPAAELVEDGDEFDLKVALAGFEPEEIAVTATPHELMIKASHEAKQKKKKQGEKEIVHWSEFRSNDVFRRIELPSDVDVDKISADYRRGLLEIEAPKAAKAKKLPTQVKISSAAA